MTSTDGYNHAGSRQRLMENSLDLCVTRTTNMTSHHLWNDLNRWIQPRWVKSRLMENSLDLCATRTTNLMIPNHVPRPGLSSLREKVSSRFSGAESRCQIMV